MSPLNILLDIFVRPCDEWIDFNKIASIVE
jgi:hypothetical protein